MNFPDSFFESSSSSDDEGAGAVATGKEGRKQEKVVYKAKICESEWFTEQVGAMGLQGFSSTLEQPVNSNSNQQPERPSDPTSIHSHEFTVLKHRADLLYYQKQYQKAIELYRRVLGAVPESNVCVTREIRDAIARCYLKLGNGHQAKEEAEIMVRPPHDKDWSSWKLLSQCHEILRDYEAQVMALQTSASLQRCHSDFWILLSDAYNRLGTVVVKSSRDQSEPLISSTPSSQAHGPPPLSQMLLQNCTLENDSLITPRQDDPSLPYDGPTQLAPCLHRSTASLTSILTRTVQLFRPYFSWREKAADDHRELKEEELPQHNGGIVSEKDDVYHDDEELSAVSGENGSHSTCPKVCPFHGVPVFEDMSLYSKTVLHYLNSYQRLKTTVCEHFTASESPLAREIDRCPGLSLPLCFPHSPFVLLVRRVLPPEELVRLVEELCELSYCANAYQLVASVYTMAACSCLVWARQLLLYSVRHSHSFPRRKLQAQLLQVERKLKDHHTPTTAYILNHFSKKAVFDKH